MMQLAATSAKNRFGEMLDMCQREPVIIEKSGRAYSVVISMAEYKRLLAQDVNQATSSASQKEQSSKGAAFYTEYKEWVDWSNKTVAEHGIFGEQYRAW